MATADHHESAPRDPTRHDPTPTVLARTLILDELFALPLDQALQWGSCGLS